MSQITFRTLSSAEIPWNEIGASWDCTVFQSPEWLDYLSETRGARQVVAKICEGPSAVGYFIGMTVRKFGLKILGSPLPGWTTPYMGFILPKGFEREKVLKALPSFAFDGLGCVHFEVCDRFVDRERAEHLPFQRTAYSTYVNDLACSDDELFGRMSSACRRNIRKSQKCGVEIQESNDAGFADEYYEQLKQVFAKRRRVPTYGVDRVRALMRRLHPTGRLLLLRARDADGKCIATGIYPGLGPISQFWGNASLQSHLLLRPNEAIHWYAMRYWKARGVTLHDWGGGGSYKEKYGGVWTETPHFMVSRWSFLQRARNTLKELYRSKSRLEFQLRNWLKGRHAKPAVAESDEEG